MTRRRTFLKSLGVAGSVALAGCGGSGDGGGGDGSSDGSSGSTDAGTSTSGDGQMSDGMDPLNFVLSIKGMGQGGLFAQAKAADWYTQDMDNVSVQIVDGKFSATAQNNRTKAAITDDTDGVILNPFDAKASKQIVKAAQSQDIPVFNFDTATLSKDIPLGVLFGQYNGGKVVAERFKENILPEMPENPNIISAVFSFESTTSKQRLNGFLDNVPDRVNNVNTVVSTGAASEAAQPILNAIRGTDKEIHGIYSNNVGSGLGALTALKQLGRYAKKGSGDHVPAFGIDGGPTLNQRIKEGYYDFAVDQPLHFYAPLALELMFTHHGVDPENSGTRPDSLPEPGDGKLTTDDLKPANKEVFETKPWAKNFWAPAETTVYEANDTEWWPWVKVGHATIDQETADAPYLFGNVLREFNQ